MKTREVRTKTVTAADLFCGAGGTSTGLARACADLGLGLELMAINHWQVAIETHVLNHPGARHLCESLDNVDPRKMVPEGHLKILVASPECTHHSIARGGKPMSDQSRATAWHILRWAEALYIENIVIENVREFRTWGPLGANGRPMRSKRGELYRNFLSSLRALGYTVEDRILNAADFGDPTTRERLFILAKRGRKPIRWPEPTHAKKPESELFGGVAPWRTAREIIDWTLPGESIFTRKRPLSDATMERIAAGLKKFCGDYAEPFLVILQRNRNARSVDQPLPAVLCSGAHFGVCQPFIVPHRQFHNLDVDSVDRPLRTVTTKHGFGLVEPFLVPFFGEREGQEPRCHSVDDPLPTVTGHGAGGLVQPFITTAEHGGHALPIDDPLPTVTSADAWGLVEPFLVSVNHGDGTGRRAHSVDDPMPTVTARQGVGVCNPFLVKYNGTAKARPVTEPMDTVTTRDRFGLVDPQLEGLKIDIRFRMLKPRELARAQGFPDDYAFAGNREAIVKQIGNAVPVNLARALCREILAS